MGRPQEGAGNVWEGVQERWLVVCVMGGQLGWAVVGRALRKNGLVSKNGLEIWDGVKEKWGGFKEWAGSLWEGTKETWNGF